MLTCVVAVNICYVAGNVIVASTILASSLEPMNLMPPWNRAVGLYILLTNPNFLLDNMDSLLYIDHIKKTGRIGTMRAIIGLMVCLVFMWALPAIGDRIIRDRYGNVVSTWDRGSDGNVTVRDRSGNITGFRQYDSGTHDVTVRDRYGDPTRYEDYSDED